MLRISHLTLSIVCFYNLLASAVGDGIPLSACRVCCDGFPYGSSFQIGCRTVGCLIGENGSCPGGLTPAGSGCEVGQQLITTSQAQIQDRLFVCEYSENIGAVLLDRVPVNTLDECGSCCNKASDLFGGFNSESCIRGCLNSCSSSDDTSCQTGSDFLLIGKAIFDESSLTCSSGELFATPKPTSLETLSPTSLPTSTPTDKPSLFPTKYPTLQPTKKPTRKPTSSPSLSPTKIPTSIPTNVPTPKPSVFPTASPTSAPSEAPSRSPSASPTTYPLVELTSSPIKVPSTSPSAVPSRTPSESPTIFPTVSLTSAPQKLPTSEPTTATPVPVLTKSPTSLPTKAPESGATYSPTTSDSQPAYPIKSPTRAPAEMLTPTKFPSQDDGEVAGSAPQVRESSSGLAATIVGLVAGLITSSGLCIFFLSVGSRKPRYVRGGGTSRTNMSSQVVDEANTNSNSVTFS